MTSLFQALGSPHQQATLPSDGGVAELVLDRRPRFDGLPVDFLPSWIPEARRGRHREVSLPGDEVLHRPASEVTAFGTQSLRSLIDDLFATMAITKAYGMAANQIGVDARVFVYDCPDAGGVRHVGHVVNPILEAMRPANRREWHTEGCLSVPGATADVARTVTATVRGWDLMGKPIIVEGTGRLARCLQHEVDHLKGTLFLDHLAGRERHRVLREMELRKRVVWQEWDRRASEVRRPAHPDPYQP